MLNLITRASDLSFGLPLGGFLTSLRTNIICMKRCSSFLVKLSGMFCILRKIDTLTTGAVSSATDSYREANGKRSVHCI